MKDDSWSIVNDQRYQWEWKKRVKVKKKYRGWQMRNFPLRSIHVYKSPVDNLFFVLCSFFLSFLSFFRPVPLRTRGGWSSGLECEFLVLFHLITTDRPPMDQCNGLTDEWTKLLINSHLSATKKERTRKIREEMDEGSDFPPFHLRLCLLFVILIWFFSSLKLSRVFIYLTLPSSCLFFSVCLPVFIWSLFYLLLFFTKFFWLPFVSFAICIILSFCLYFTIYSLYSIVYSINLCLGFCRNIR